MTYPLATSSWDNAEIEALERVIASGMFTMGKNVATFELLFADFVGSKYAVMMNSGSSANLLMVAALFFRKSNPLRSGDEVIVPAVSWPTTYYPLAQYGLKLKFVDIDIETLNYDLQSLQSSVDSNTKAIVAVNLLGNPNEFSVIESIARQHQLILIEDNCESLGAVYSGRQAGTFGLLGTYSTFFSHHMSTMEGGVVVTDDEELYHILLSLRAHGWTRNLPQINRLTGTKSSDAFDESFKFVLPGYNVRPLEFEGAVGIEQLKKLPEFIRMRRRNAAIFVDALKTNPKFIAQREIGQSSWFGFSIVARRGVGVDRQKLVQVLSENGVECRPIVAGNFAKNPVVSHFNYSVHGSLKNAEWIDANGLFVGNHHFDITDNIRALAQLLSSFA